MCCAKHGQLIRWTLGCHRYSAVPRGATLIIHEKQQVCSTECLQTSLYIFLRLTIYFTHASAVFSLRLNCLIAH